MHFAERLCFDVQTSHVTPEQAGHLFKAAQPKLGVLHHLLVNYASRSAIVTAVRETYDGPITINEDLMAFDLTREEIVIHKRLVPRAVGAIGMQSSTQMLRRHMHCSKILRRSCLSSRDA